MMNRFFPACVALALGLTATERCQGAVVNERLYRLGEDDAPPPVALGPGNDPTVDSGTAALDASKIGLAFYHGLSGGGGPPVLLGLVSGSTVAMRFTNIDSRYVAPAALVGVTQSFGMEAYIQVGAGVSLARVFYNGGDGTPFGTLTSGYGLGIQAGQYAAIVAGSVFPTGVFAVPGMPVQVALVNLGGTQFDVYVQKVLVLTFFVAAVNPPAATEVLSLGNFLGNQSAPAFAGVVDEARVFTFTGGGFDPSTDLGPAASVVLAGTPGQANCHGRSVSGLARQFGGLPAAAAALGFSSVDELQDAIRAFCEE